jgi:hypothetical protein
MPAASLAGDRARAGFPTAAQRLLSFLTVVTELGGKEGLFRQSEYAVPKQEPPTGEVKGSAGRACLVAYARGDFLPGRAASVSILSPQASAMQGV